ncbi:MAG: hypothetical protein HN352_02120 [Bacteroidetes bacterium]|jgi:hypothetical protein|nr:hypothetical protein [Bacteroidota bacterium]MBT3749390.1 hypothetical protein [Bacteroidota bacterium]MBT4398229.1 hypothetical protein [Bacteroidota bacterium]MBT4409013.1 hypothetical protein [Bacteroidota bacterium]MBT5426867.1 hypothetical protein [Bacteroidota bacterium]
MKAKIIIITIVLALVYALSAYFGFQTYQSSKAYLSVENEHIDQQIYKSRLLSPKEWFPKISPRQDVSKKTSRLESESAFHKKTLERNAFFASISMLAFLVLALFFVKFFKLRPEYNILIVSLGSFLLLIIGLVSPLLEIWAYEENLTIPVNIPLFRDKVFYGKMYFYYQNKSILSLIGFLFNSKNWIVAIPILIASVILPLVKLTLITLISVFKISKNWIESFLAIISPWSMLDIFTVSILLAFLGLSDMNMGVETKTLIGPGFWFFLAYCVLSIMNFHWYKTKFSNQTQLLRN